VSERLDAHVLRFPPGCPPVWKVYPKNLAESEAGSGTGSGPGAGPRSGAVLAEPGEPARADIPKSGRVFRVVVCPSCGWQYGSYWPRQDPVTWGDCPSCGSVTVIESAYRPAFGCVGSKVREARGPAQQELGL
jgi:hypothetical protein